MTRDANLLGKPPAREDIADRREILAILSQQARAGKVAAAAALERALRTAGKTGPTRPGAGSPPGG